MDVPGSYEGKVIWELIEDNVVEDPKKNYEIGLRVFIILF